MSVGVKLPKSITYAIVLAVLAMLFVMAIALWQEWDLGAHLWSSMLVGIIIYLISAFFFYKKGLV